MCRFGYVNLQADLNGVVNNGNDKHLASWAEACSTENIQNTPLDPTMTTEHLLNMHIHIDGSKLESIGFVIQEDHITKEKLQMVFIPNDFISFLNHIYA